MSVLPPFVNTVLRRYHRAMSKQRSCELIERIGSLLRAEARQAGAGHGLQPVQMQALAYFTRANRYSDTPAALTDYLGVTKGTASQTLMVLEGLGLVSKREDKQDRRVTRVQVTAKGRHLLDKLLPSALWRAASAGLSVAAAQRIEDDLVRLLRVLQQANQSRTFGVCNTCEHFLREGGRKFRCGLTAEPLSAEESQLICREHELKTGT